MIPGRELMIESALRIVRRRIWLLLIPFLLGILGGLLVSWWVPSLYRSDAVVQVVPQRVPEAYIQSTVTARVEDRLNSISQQVLSRTQLETVIVEFGLFQDERARKPMEDVIELMTKRVEIASLEPRGSSRSTDVDAFRISFEYENPQVSRDVVAKLAGFFIDRNASERGSQAEQTSQFLEAQLMDARQRLETQERRLEAFREQNSGRLPTQMQTNLQAIQSSQLALQALVESLARDRDRRLMLDRLYSEASADTATTAAPGSPVPSATQADTGSGLPPTATPEQRLQAARESLARMELRLTPKHPDVLRTKRLIEELEKQVAAGEETRPLSPEAVLGTPPTSPEDARRRDRLREMRVEIESLDRQIAFKEGEEKRLRAQVGTYQARLEAVPGIESEWVALTRDYDTLQAAYRDLLAKSENSKMAASLEQRQIGEQFRILDPPRVPLKPASPNRIRINAIATLLGLGLGVLLIWLAEYRDSTFRSEDDVLGALELPVLVVVPFVMTDADRRRRRRRRLLVSAAATLACVATGALFWYLQLWKFVV